MFYRRRKYFRSEFIKTIEDIKYIDYMIYRKMLFILGMGLMVSCRSPNSSDYSTWAFYSGTKDGNRYSSNEQINLGNVDQLKVAWSYSTHDKDTSNRSEIQCNPIVVDGILYGVSRSEERRVGKECRCG